MTKRVTICLAALVLLLGMLAVPVCAQELTDGIRSAYIREGNLYAFLELPENVQADAVTAQINGRNQQGTFPLKAGCEAVSYLFVVDAVSAMPEDIQTMLCSIAQGLSEQPGQKQTFAVAALGGEWELLESGMTRIEEVRSCFDKLRYGPEAGNLCGGLSGAISWLRSLDRTPGSLSNVIFVASGRAEGQSSEAAALLAAVIETSPEVLLHTVSMASWGGEVYDAVTAGRGIHTQPQTAAAAYTAGRAIAEYGAGLNMAVIPWGEGLDSVSLQLAVMTDAEPLWLKPVETVPNLDIKPIASQGGISGETAAPVPETAEPAQEETTEPAQEETTEPAQETVPETAAEEEDQAFDGAAAPAEENASRNLWWLIGGGAVLAAVLALVLVRLGRKGGKKGMAAVQEGIPMQLEVLSGHCKTGKRRFLLREQLLIGSGPECDIVWKDPTVSRKNCRIFLENNRIWLEDLNDRSNTSIEGMKIYAPNRLRSEDTITMGAVSFRMLF